MSSGNPAWKSREASYNHLAISFIDSSSLIVLFEINVHFLGVKCCDVCLVFGLSMLQTRVMMCSVTGSMRAFTRDAQQMLGGGGRVLQCDDRGGGGEVRGEERGGGAQGWSKV